METRTNLANAESRKSAGKEGGTEGERAGNRTAETNIRGGKRARFANQIYSADHRSYLNLSHSSAVGGRMHPAWATLLKS